jgi:hypothetical protein
MALPAARGSPLRPIEGPYLAVSPLIGWWCLLSLALASHGQVETARQAETEATPMRYVAELVGADTDSRTRHPLG